MVRIEGADYRMVDAGGIMIRCACWAKFGDVFTGHTLPCGHFIPEEAPVPMLKAVEEFL